MFLFMEEICFIDGDCGPCFFEESIGKKHLWFVILVASLGIFSGFSGLASIAIIVPVRIKGISP